MIYQTEDGQAQIEVRLEEETIWLSQQQLVLLFKQTKQNISLHINNIFREKELEPGSVVKEYLTTAADEKNYRVKHYNLDVIISVGYRVKAKIGTQFRIWASQVLKDHLIKGYTLNQKRLQESKERFHDLKKAIAHASSVSQVQNLTRDESSGILKILDQYAFALEIKRMNPFKVL